MQHTGKRLDRERVAMALLSQRLDETFELLKVRGQWPVYTPKAVVPEELLCVRLFQDTRFCDHHLALRVTRLLPGVQQARPHGHRGDRDGFQLCREGY